MGDTLVLPQHPHCGGASADPSACAYGCSEHCGLLCMAGDLQRDGVGAGAKYPDADGSHPTRVLWRDQVAPALATQAQAAAVLSDIETPPQDLRARTEASNPGADGGEALQTFLFLPWAEKEHVLRLLPSRRANLQEVPGFLCRACWPAGSRFLRQPLLGHTLS